MKNSSINKRNIILYIIGIILLFLLIELLSIIINNPLIFPNIFVIFKEIFIILTNGSFYISLGTTILELFISIIIVFILGITLGLIAGINQNISIILKPIMSFLRCIPIIVIIISSLIIFSNNRIIPIISIILILILLPIVYEGVLEGTKNIDRSLIDVYRLDSKININIIIKVYLPLINSHIKEVFVSSIGLGIKALITIEYICGIRNTIGNLIMNGVNDINYVSIYAYTIILALLIILLENLIGLIFKLLGYK